MFVILASRYDLDAARMAAEWRDRGARLLTCADLSCPGWVLRSGAPERSAAVLEGQIIPAAEIRGVFTRLPGVNIAELPHIAPVEQGYVSAEMTAFLLAWLASLPCKVANRPTPLNLRGPSWRPEQWLWAARSAGLQTMRTRLSIPQFKESTRGGVSEDSAVTPTSANMTVALVGERVFVEGDEQTLDGQLVASLSKLASAAQVGLLTATFVQTPGACTLLSADSDAPIALPGVAQAVLEYIGLER